MPLKTHIEIHGHRGARGLWPENTITGFIEAVKSGVDYLEMDVIISGDKKVVVSHEPWMNPDFCTDPAGKEIENSGEQLNLYKMSYAEIIRYDCGKKGNKEFPLQKAVPEYKPLLWEVVTKVDAFSKANHLPPVNYNIEIKSEIQHDEIYNPMPGIFVDLVYEEIKKLHIEARIILQSFDVRILREIRQKDPSIPISLLVENTDGLETNLKNLGFMPDIYAPDFHLINEALIQGLNIRNIKLITWTVNEISDMKKMIELGVKGIITDYPNRLNNLIKEIN
ncbi:MAG: glycerophosphodiester phosphodiesterase family protein [Bacteroidia bacterium]